MNSNFSTFNTEHVNTLFEPIISINRKLIIGYESILKKAFESTVIKSKNLQSPEIQNFCLEEILNHFSLSPNKHKLLFLSLDFSFKNRNSLELSDAVLLLSFLTRTANKYKIPHENIVIELLESGQKNMNVLSEIIEIYKKQGFLIALDDFGKGYSNLDRIAVLKPNIVKINSSLVKNIEQCMHKQEVFKAITGLSRRIGAVVVAKGIENKNEAVKCLELRADFLQGSFFSVPNSDSSSYINAKIESLYIEFKNQILFNLEVRQNRTTFLLNKLSHIKSIISTSNNLEDSLNYIVNSNNFIEAVYVLDSTGKQISSTVISPFIKCCHNRILFSSALQNSDHSLKLYYYKIKSGESDLHITEPYISNATGNRCSTLSCITDNDLILCIDIAESSDESNFSLSTV